MYIPGIIIVVLIVIYFYNQDKTRDEISSLRSLLYERDNHNSNYDFYDDFDFDEEDIPIDKTKEYTFQESQDRQFLGVTYKSTLEEIRKVYLEKLKDYNSNPKPEINISEIHSAYKRLEKIETLRKD